jgi:2-polyprenyl-6-methoxyphenol hydroxylase-like FAD-dependent oxidoreductase
VIGDAAHCTSPQLGQGANMGLLDAATLADAIASSHDLGIALDAYATARRRHVRFYQWASRWFTPLFQSDSIAAAWLRDVAMPAARLLPWSRKETVRTLAGLKTGIFAAMDHRSLIDPVHSFHRIVTET